MEKDYVPDAPGRDEVDAMAGATVLDFGTNWCGHCLSARPRVDDVVRSRPGVRHLRIEDGPGRRLGRSFGVKLWPTLVFLRDGEERARLVRPTENDEIARALATIAPDAEDEP